MIRTSGRPNAHVVAWTQVGQGPPHSQGHLDCSAEDDQGGIVLSRAVTTGPVGRGTDTIGDGPGKGYSQDSKMDDDKESFGHEAIGTSPPLEVNGANVLQPVQVQGGPNDRADDNAVSPPKTGRSSLRSSSFAPVIVPPPLHANAVDVDPDFFEGAALPGSGPGPHFITVSFIKNGKDKIKDQLLSALATTLTILSQNVPRVLIHCITKGLKIAPSDSISAGHFPTTGMGACNFMYVQNKWSLQPGTRNKLKLPAAKIGKDGRPLFDENRGYDGPDRITAVLWIMCAINAKEAIEKLQMELEGEHLQIRWKQAQKKNTRN